MPARCDPVGSSTQVLANQWVDVLDGLRNAVRNACVTSAQYSATRVRIVPIDVSQQLQAFIDRWFSRTKYDAEKTLAVFSSVLHSKVELEPVRYEQRQGVLEQFLGIGA